MLRPQEIEAASRSAHLSNEERELPGGVGFRSVDWSHVEVPPLGLRVLPPVDSGRVKAWRKAARAGELPPLLIWWVGALARHVILDGHARLAAALAEGMLPWAVSLSGFRTRAVEPASPSLLEAISEKWDRSQKGVESLNRVLVTAFEDARPEITSRASPLQLSQTQWETEVMSVRVGVEDDASREDRMFVATGERLMMNLSRERKWERLQRALK